MFFSFELREVPKIAPWSELGVQVVRMCCVMVSAGRLSLVVHRVSQPPHDKESNDVGGCKSLIKCMQFLESWFCFYVAVFTSLNDGLGHIMPV